MNFFGSTTSIETKDTIYHFFKVVLWTFKLKDREMEIFCCGHAIFVGKWTFRAIFHILTGSTLTLLMLIFTFSCICLPLVGKLLRWSVWTKSSWICSIKENRGNWLPQLDFLGVIRWVDVVLLTPTVTNICSKANSALNEVRFRRTDFGWSLLKDSIYF